MTKETKVTTLPARTEIAVEDTWRLEDIFATDEAWESAYKEVKEELNESRRNFKENLVKVQKRLFSALQFQDSVLEKLGKVYAYSHMRYDQDTTNSIVSRI